MRLMYTEEDEIELDPENDWESLGLKAWVEQHGPVLQATLFGDCASDSCLVIGKPKQKKESNSCQK